MSKNMEQKTRMKLKRNTVRNSTMRRKMKKKRTRRNKTENLEKEGKVVKSLKMRVNLLKREDESYFSMNIIQTSSLINL